jgi:uncharacterized protein
VSGRTTSSTKATAPGFSPTAAGDRIEALDALRGLALLMILAANMPAFNTPIYYLADAGQQWWTSHTDHIAETLVHTFVQTESVALFSFLFGLGFAMQLMRADSSGTSFLLLYARRLLSLIAIGLVHAYFIWMGDILVLYGLLGFLLLLLRKVGPRTVLFLAVASYLIAPARWELSVIREVSGRTAAESIHRAPDLRLAQIQAEAQKQVESSVHAYRDGTWREITAQRARDYAYYVAHNQAVTVFPLFLFGLYAGQRRLFHDLQAHARSLRRALRCSAAVAFPGIVLLRVLYLPGVPHWTAVLRPVVFVTEHAALIIFYVSSVTVVQQNARLQRVLAPLATAGRLALSNYIFQSVICTFIFYSYGLRLYGRVGPAAGLALTMAVFALQVFLSVLWSRRFRLGPLEWFWRTVTYGRVQPMRP